MYMYCMYVCIYIYIYIYIYVYIHNYTIYIYIYICVIIYYTSIIIYVCICVYIYIYIYTYNRHLGLINAPLFVVFLQTTSFTIDLQSKRPEIYKIMAKTLLIIFPPSWGDPLCENQIWHFYLINVT